MQDTERVARGLEGVVVAETRISEVDGERGRLVLRGWEVEPLSERLGFEEVCGLLWDGVVPDEARRLAIQGALGRGRAAAFGRLGSLGRALELPDAMEAVRAGLAQVSAEELGEGLEAWGGLVGAVPVIVAAWSRRRRGLDALAPDAGLGHAEDFGRMMLGELHPARARALGSYLGTVSDHGMNASTFAARVVTSTGSDAVSAVVAAVGALKGPLHGGAPGPVLDMLDAVGEPGRAESWLRAELAAGRRIMGMGHRIYRVRDPRAAALEAALGRLEAAVGASGRLPLARAVEAAALRVLDEKSPQRALRANVEFYTAVLLEAVGVPRECFAATFCVGRVVGWLAHVAEERAEGRLIRPQSRYVGPAPRGGGA
jgi:citrate synthase